MIQVMARNRRFIPLALIAALMILLGAAFAPWRARAAEPPAEPLTVKEVWLTGDTLHISVTDDNTGVNQTLELNLNQYAGVADEFVSIQAVDHAGNTSNVIQFRNPYYADALIIESTPQSAPPAQKPFTPDGTGTVLDDVTGADGKEFFSVTTEDGNVFYLIVDRQRESENVYLLNAVNEDDLASLAKPGNGLPGSVSAIATAAPTIAPAPTESPATAAAPMPEPPAKSDSRTAAPVIIAIAAVAAAGAGYYFKVVRPKRNNKDDEEYDDSDSDEADDFDDEEIDTTEEDGDKE